MRGEGVWEVEAHRQGSHARWSFRGRRAQEDEQQEGCEAGKDRPGRKCRTSAESLVEKPHQQAAGQGGDPDVAGRRCRLKWLGRESGMIRMNSSLRPAVGMAARRSGMKRQSG